MRNNKKLIFIIIVLFSVLCSLIILNIFWEKNIYQDDQLRKCKILSQKYRDVCLYETAIKTAYTNTSKAHFICSIIKDKYNNGRCYSDILPTIEDNNPTKINESLVICENIKHIFWKSECYFNVAESAYSSFLNPNNYFINKSKINLALDICEKSKLFKNNCYFQVIGNLNSIKANEICKYRSKKYKNICYYILGANLAVDIYLPENKHKCLNNFNGCYSEAFSFCQSIEEKYRLNCNMGLWAGLDYGNLLYICESVNKTYKGSCYYSLGVAIGQIKLNPPQVICENVREGYKIDCYEGFWKFIRDQENPKICELYNETYKQRCYNIFNECFEVDGLICCDNSQFRISCRSKLSQN